MRIILVLSFLMGGLPSYLSKVRVINVSKIFTLQISKIDPAKLAFNEVFNQVITDSAKKETTNSFTNLSNSANNNAGINSNTKNLYEKENIHLNAALLASDEDPNLFLQKIKKEKHVLSKLTVRLSDPPIHFQTQDRDDEIGRLITSERIQGNVNQNSYVNNGGSVDSNRKNVHPPTPDENKDSELTKTGTIRLTGPIELGYENGKGLPWGPGYHMEVRRIHESIAKEPGRIDTDKHIYQINVDQWSGSIVAVLMDDTGKVLGRGSFPLTEARKGKSPNQIGEPLIIKPVNDGINITYKEHTGSSHHQSNVTIAGYSNAISAIKSENLISPMVLDSAASLKIKKTEDGVYQHEGLSSSSWSIVRTSQKGYAEQIQLIPSGFSSTIYLFRNTFIEAIKRISIDHILQSRLPQNGSMVWGQVKSGAVGLSGVKVTVENYEDQQVIYLNESLIPDTTLKTTSTSGYFVIFDLPTGFHHLLAEWNHQYFTHINAVVEENTLTTVEMEKTIEFKQVDLKVFNAFTKNIENAKVTLQSYADPIDVYGFKSIYTPKLKRLSLAQAQASDAYAPAIYDYDDEEDFIHIPLIQRSWLQFLLSESKINQSPDLGMVVGFVPDEAFIVDESLLSSSAKLIYFDGNGNPAEEGIPGGGFVIANLAEGAQGLTVKAINTNRKSSKAVPIDSQNLFVGTFRF